MNSFARDVGINVLANILATWVLALLGSVVYLVGASVGAFPRVDTLTGIAVVVMWVTTVGACGLAFVLVFLLGEAGKPLIRAVDTAIIGLFGFCVAVEARVIYMLAESDLASWYWVFGAVMPAMAVLAWWRLWGIWREARLYSKGPQQPAAWSPDPRAYL